MSFQCHNIKFYWKYNPNQRAWFSIEFEKTYFILTDHIIRWVKITIRKKITIKSYTLFIPPKERVGVMKLR